MRLFVAVAVPDRVAGLVAALPRPDRHGVRWTTPAQWHVTLRFLGDAPTDAVAMALAGVEALGGGPLVASLGPTTGWFPGRRVLQIPVRGLDGLAGAVHQVTRAWGPESDPPYRAHLTLARTIGRRRGPHDLAGTPFATAFPVGEFGLYSSSSGRPGAGPVYDRIATYPVG